jgi:acetyl esterase/lipase
VLPGAPERGLPAWFAARGCVFVAPNFRLLGRHGATVAEMADDVAKALKWLTVNVRKFGGRSDGFVLAGYSSGAHLAALVATDPSRLAAHRLTPAVVSGVLGLDVPFYDVPAAMASLAARVGDGPQAEQRLESAREVMGATVAEQEQVSPSSHLGPWMSHIRFLLVSAGVHGGRGQDLSRAMSEAFAVRLKAMKVAARHEHFPGLDHHRVLEDFEGRPSVAVEEFLKGLERRG